MLATRNMVMFPGVIAPVLVGRASSINLVSDDSAMLLKAANDTLAEMVLFDVMDATALNHLTHSMLPYDSTMVEQLFANSPLYPHLRHTAGYYIDKQEDDQWQYLFYDTVGGHLVYYLSLM